MTHSVRFLFFPFTS